ncbi:pyridoxamine 5'-phosphate oxidase family protein [Peptostreptococcus equinus]|uniref:Pyridoxamine 5'-phosphate oxidase family protein n=1 Tax=Peptostreptococcus equinus TaxID=3003601 RepID=A0ABY7JPN7_9FIRM|nr:pyridoxamine 5'-phosphate oxidase family protein [Peptostreptococcus sp. CBA3647]WAW15328.1 pyridoxamine 5'-phosphate oxidase family protein [Peptostreptococcus sp. CBA3647]
MNNINKVSNFLEMAKVFYLSTVDLDIPKCRPLGLFIEHNDKIYFCVGDHKEVYKQIQNNNNIEICATVNTDFLRYYGKAVFTDDELIYEKALKALPMLSQLYNEKTGFKMKMFYLDNATAEFRDMMSIKEKIEF